MRLRECGGDALEHVVSGARARTKRVPRLRSAASAPRAPPRAPPQAPPRAPAGAAWAAPAPMAPPRLPPTAPAAALTVTRNSSTSCGTRGACSRIAPILPGPLGECNGRERDARARVRRLAESAVRSLGSGSLLVCRPAVMSGWLPHLLVRLPGAGACDLANPRSTRFSSIGQCCCAAIRCRSRSSVRNSASRANAVANATASGSRSRR